MAPHKLLNLPNINYFGGTSTSFELEIIIIIATAITLLLQKARNCITIVRKELNFAVAKLRHDLNFDSWQQPTFT